MPASLYPPLSCLGNDTAVHLQARHCGSTSCRYPDDLCPICLPMKMRAPLLLTGIEERHLGIGLWVNTCLIIAFESVTRLTFRTLFWSSEAILTAPPDERGGRALSSALQTTSHV